MIASGYTLDLYCDTPECKGQASFFHESPRKAWAMSRKAGWLVTPDRDAFCPTCTKAPKRKPPR